MRKPSGGGGYEEGPVAAAEQLIGVPSAGKLHGRNSQLLLK